MRNAVGPRAARPIAIAAHDIAMADKRTKRLADVRLIEVFIRGDGSRLNATVFDGVESITECDEDALRRRT
jgi:hypothetical protein